MNIKAVLIDIDNTLLDFDKSALEAMLIVANKYSVIFPDGFFEVFQKINNKLWSELEEAAITKSDIYKRRWKEIFDELGITADHDAFEEDFRKELRNIAVPVDGAEELLRYLSGKYPVYSASNASKPQQEIRLEKAGLLKYFSGMFISEDIGFQKPSKEFFYACCSELYPLKAEEIVMIGDSVDADIIGAKNFGLKSIWFNYYNKEYDSYNFTDKYVSKLEDIKNII